MTNDQHITNLKKLRSFHNGSYGESINAGIKALEQQKTGEWIYVEDDVVTDTITMKRYKCSNCDRTILANETDFEGIFALKKAYPYCHCGSYNGGDKNE